jgi:site-specific recombinase XerD
LALQVKDIHLDQNYFDIKRTTTLNKKGQVILGDTTKTPTGERMVVLNEITKPILQHAIENRNASKNDLIFCKEDGTLYGNSGINSAFKRLCKNAGIQGDVNVHICRHSFITRSKEAGVDVDATKSVVGHNNIHLTQDVYNENQKDYLEIQSKIYSNYILNLTDKNNI